MDIKELRKSKGMTQVEFARTVGIKESAVAAIETGRRKLNDETIAKIREMFGVEVDAEVKVSAKTSRSRKKTAKDKAALEKRGIVIQSPLGGEITPEEILAKVGKVDVVYVRVDENKAYWVKGKKNGEVDLW